MDTLAFRRARVALSLLALLALFGSSLPVEASPVCSDIPREACGGRIFPEAENTASFVQHDNGEYLAGIQALAEEFPRFVKVRDFSDVLGREVKSAGGRDIWLIEITDFKAPEKNKVAAAVSLAIHGPERAGLEGGVRYMEDLAGWAAGGDQILSNGTEKDSIEVPVREALRKVHLYLAAINVDGWAAGDAEHGGVFMRGNENGVDLNREFPTKGWTKASYTPMSEPEVKAWVQLMRKIKPVTAVDLHGELTSAQNTFTDIMYPAGQWNPLEQAQEERFARHMASNVSKYFERDGVVLQEATGQAGMTPSQYATAYDVVGYDDSGFQGDFLTEQIGATEVDIEHFFSHMVPNSTWFAPLEKAHIAAVRGEIETVIVEAMVTNKVSVRLNLGKIGYLLDPRIVTDADGYGGPPPQGIKPRSYRVTRMKYFRDLGRYTTESVRAVARRDLLKDGLRGLDTFVISDNAFPKDALGRKPGKPPRIAAKLEAWVKNGGNLVLTDGAIRLLRRMKIVPKDAVAKRLYNAGHVNIDDFDDPYMKKVHSTSSQTYFEVPLGFSVDTNAAPHWIVSEAAWTEAGGVKVAHIDDADTEEAETDQVGVGRLKLGKGTIGIFGAILPQPTEKFDHYFGLADYALSVAGGQILHNMIAFAR